MIKSMLNDYAKSKSLRSNWAGKLLALALACLTFILAAWLVVQLFSLVSPKHRKAIREEQAREQDFIRRLDFYVVDSGYVKRSSGAKDIYIPMVKLHVANLSGRIIKGFWLGANFERAGEFLCRADRLVADLEPGESLDVGLSCAEATFVGTVFTGLSLAQTTEAVSYVIWVQSGRVSASLLKDVLTFRIVQSRGSY